MTDKRTVDEDHSTMTESNSRYGQLRNHVIPIFHMRRFAHDALVYTYDIEEAKKASRYGPPRQSVNNATVVRGFYTDEQESHLSEQFEQGIKAILNKIDEQYPLSSDERLRFCRYIYAYRIRTHWMLRTLQDNYRPYMQQFIREESEKWSFVQTALYDTNQPIDDRFFENVNQALSMAEDELNDAETVALRSHSIFSEGSVLSSRSSHADKQLAALPWRVFISSGSPFVLGDRFFELNAQDQPIFEMYCPISSKCCLFISRYAPRASLRVEDMEYIPVDESVVRAVNVRTVALSQRYVVSGHDLSWVGRARKTPPSKHRELRVPKLQMDQLVGGYIASRCPKCWWALTLGDTLERQLEEVNEGQPLVNTYKQSVCSNRQCGFTTDFRTRSDRTAYPPGIEANSILKRLRPSDRDQLPVEDAQ